MCKSEVRRVFSCAGFIKEEKVLLYRMHESGDGGQKTGQR